MDKEATCVLVGLWWTVESIYWLQERPDILKRHRQVLNGSIREWSAYLIRPQDHLKANS